MGHDERPVIPDRDAKSVGAEDTFEDDLADREQLLSRIHAQALRVGRRLRHAKVQARGVTLKVKFSNFDTISRHATLEPATDDGQALFVAARRMFERIAKSSIRLTGISADHLQHGEGQLDLFGEPTAARARKLNATLDRLAERFGREVVTTADVSKSEGDGIRSQFGMKRSLPKE